MRCTRLALITTCIVFITGAALATPLQADRTFAIQAAQSGLAEVQNGQLATQKASRQDVRDFGRVLVSNHTSANQQLQQIARQENLSLPTGPSAKQQAQHRQLAAMSEAGFNTAFPRDEIAGHKQAIALFQQEAQSGQDPALRSFARKSLPMLREHLKAAQTLDNAG